VYSEYVPNHKVVDKILNTLSKKFDSIFVMIQEEKYLIQLYVDELMESILSHESIINRNDNSLLENAFKTRVSLSIGRGILRGGGRGRSNRGRS